MKKFTEENIEDYGYSISAALAIYDVAAKLMDDSMLDISDKSFSLGAMAAQFVIIDGIVREWDLSSAERAILIKALNAIEYSMEKIEE